MVNLAPVDVFAKNCAAKSSERLLIAGEFTYKIYGHSSVGNGGFASTDHVIVSFQLSAKNVLGSRVSQGIRDLATTGCQDTTASAAISSRWDCQEWCKAITRKREPTRRSGQKQLKEVRNVMERSTALQNC